MTNFRTDRTYALEADKMDSLSKFRDKFLIPPNKEGKESIYFVGNSLGLQPRQTRQFIDQELEDWHKFGVEGFFQGKNRWVSYHKRLSAFMSEIVGANEPEVIVMNTLTVNLHLMMVSFYTPDSERYKVLMESDAFPSDKYAVESQIRLHGYDPDQAIIEIKPREGEFLIREEDLMEVIDREGEAIDLILLGNPNYYTGQVFDMKEIASAAHKKGSKVGFDCAHGAGNIPLNLHDSDIDFAVWCNYKYLNSGPGSIGSAFVHEKHHQKTSLNRLNGWWGHKESTRFNMRGLFEGTGTAEDWQLSTPPVLSMAAILSSLHIFHEAGMDNLREKSIRLTGYLEFLINNVNIDGVKIISPLNPAKRGAQLSFFFESQNGKKVFDALADRGVVADWREPNVIRIAPVPLYNSYSEVFEFVRIFSEVMRLK